MTISELSFASAAALLAGGNEAPAAARTAGNAAVDGADADDGGEGEGSDLDLSHFGNKDADDFSFLDGMNQPEDEDKAPVNQDPTAPDTDTPADQGETKEGDVDQGDALPPIEAPSSWTAEEKATWDATPRKAQEAILRRELDSTKELRNLQNSSAEQRKTAEAEVTKIKGLTSQIEAVVQRDVAQLSRDFPEIKTEADVAALASSDPARFSAFQGRLMALNAASQVQRDALAQVAAAEKTKEAEFQSQAKVALLEAFPAWKDAEVARKEVTEIQDYAIKQGAPETAARASLDPVIYKLAQKAMLYDKAQAAKAQAVTRTPPRAVNKQGSSNTNPRGAAKEEIRRAQFEKLTRSGDPDDALALMFE